MVQHDAVNAEICKETIESTKNVIVLKWQICINSNVCPVSSSFWGELIDPKQKFRLRKKLLPLH